MQLIFSPKASADPFTLEKRGDALIINGESFDFAPLGPGEALPGAAVASPFVAGTVRRTEAGELVIPLRLPCGPRASRARRFPKSCTVTADGVISLPE